MKTKVEQINDLYLQSRQRGHTSALLHSKISEKTPTLIVHNETFGDYVKNSLSVREIKTVSVRNLDSLRGTALDGPLLVDNATFLELANEVRLIRQERDDLKEKIAKLKEILR